VPTPRVLSDRELNRALLARQLLLKRERVIGGDGLDDVGAGRAEQDHQDRRLVVGHAHRAYVFHAVRHIGHVGKANGRTISIGDDQGAVLVRPRRRVVDIDLIALGALLDRALGSIGVRRGERRAHILQTDAVFE